MFSRIIWLCFIFCIIVLNSFASETRVVGNIYNSTFETISIKFNSNKPNGKQEIISGTLEDGRFELNFDLHDYVEAFLYNGRNKICKFYLEPNEHLGINVDLNDINNSLFFEGEKAAKDNFWVSFNQLYPNFGKKAFYYKPFSFFTTKDNVAKHLSTRDENLYMQYVEDKYLNYTNALNNFTANYAVDEGSLANIKSIFASRKMNDIISFYYLEQSYLKKDVKVSQELKVNLLNLNSYMIDQLNNVEYVNLMKSYLAYLNLIDQKPGQTDSSYEQYKLIAQNFDGPIKYYLQTLLITKDLGNKDIQLWEIVKPEYVSENPFYEWNTLCDNMYKKILIKSSSISNASFYLPNQNSTYKSSSEYRGKLVYISFWAAWCKPCLENFQNFKSKKKELEEKGVVFVNINIDGSLAKAYNAIAQHNIEGVNLFANDEADAISKQFNVTTLPAYFLLDQNGNLTPYTGNLSTVAKDIESLLY